MGTRRGSALSGGRHLADDQHVAGRAPDDLGAHRAEQRGSGLPFRRPDHEQVGAELVRLLHQLLGRLSARLVVARLDVPTLQPLARSAGHPRRTSLGAGR